MKIEAPDWVCEQHPWLEWPHDNCVGPGMPPLSFSELSKVITNTRGVSEAMVDEGCAAFSRLQGRQTSTCIHGGTHTMTELRKAVRATIEAALSAPEPAAQGEGEPVADLEPFREAIVFACTNGNMDKWRRVLASFDSFAYRYKRNTHPAPAASPAGVPDRTHAHLSENSR